MSDTSLSSGRHTLSGVDVALSRLAEAATLLLPVLLFFSRAGADIVVSVIAVLFLLHSLIQRSWQWMRAGWFLCGFGLWAVILVSSVIAGPTSSAIQGALSLRFFVFCAAVCYWMLNRANMRRSFVAVCAALAFWTLAQSWLQLLSGHNLAGYPRWGDGALTGPFRKPRAGNALLMVFFPGLMPLVLNLLHRPGRTAQIGGIALLLFSATTMILIGQRMSTLLMLTGLGITALLFRRLRWPVIATLALAGAVLAALPILSPPTYAKLVLKFSTQLTHFAQSDYGMIYTRAAVMTAAHPWIGSGFDGFRHYCSNPAYFHGLPSLGLSFHGPAERGCNIHPHNYYLQAAVSGGLTGLALFCGMILCWGRRLLSALDPQKNPLQAMLTVASVIILWPAASTSALFSLPPAGWIFLIAGCALAASLPEKHS
ncbi:MAG: O-antigen ligase family protein [Acetobacter sp.]|jgi:O-antigen ligase